MVYGQLLFYCGIVIAITSFIAGIVSFIVLKLKTVRLKAMLDKEYGVQDKKHSRS